MARDPKAEAALALHRFGLGPRAGSIAAIASDPRGALIAELDRPAARRIAADGLMDSAAAARAAAQFRQAQQQMRREANGQNPQPKNAERPKNAEPSKQPPARPTVGSAPQQLYLDEARARLGAELGFAERLVWFWSNHFCVSADKAGVRPIAGAFEREAIRAHVLGRFADMLLAVESHPAMLIYLDNARSVGPNSQAGRNRGRGLNENLAREILELHTLGVRSVYSQDDVTSFAKVITGWTVVPARQEERGGTFNFNPRMHEPGAQTVVGVRYAQGGVEQGRAVLNDIARHPAIETNMGAAWRKSCPKLADWPGLRDADLHERRDLKPTTDLRAVLKGLLRDHLRVDEAALAAPVFPDSAAVVPVAGLLA